MIRIPRSKCHNTDSISVDPFWNVGDEKEQRMHRIHSYPAKFPAFITTKALEYAHAEGLNTRLIADIFCGCGTVAYEAKRNSIPFWGCDINPVATLIASAKSSSYQTWRLSDYLDRIDREFRDTRFADVSYASTNERIRYWFDSSRYRDLARLRRAIYKTVPPGSKYRTFFLVAFSNILKSCSRWLTKSIKPQVDPDKIPANAIVAFREQCQFAILANEESDARHDSPVRIETANILSPTLSRPMVDMIITSPPYVTSYEYADLHQLSVIWLSKSEDYRDLRSGSIGSLHHDSDFDKDRKDLNRSGRAIVTKLNNVDTSKAKSVAKYFIDMQAVADVSYQMLSRKGLALFVIGNTKYSGVTIDNAGHLAESLFDAGFATVNMTKRKISKKILTPYRDKRGRFTTDARGRKVYSEEFIVIGKKL